MEKTYLKYICILHFVTSVNCLPAYLSFLFKDPVKYTIEEVYNCAPDVWNFTGSANFINDTHVIVSGTGNIAEDFDDKLHFLVESWQYLNKKWIKLINVKRQKACSILEKGGIKELFLLGTVLLGAPINCPIPKGVYSIDELMLDISDTFISHFLPGRFKGKATLYNSKNKLLACGIGVMTSTLRKSKN